MNIEEHKNIIYNSLLKLQNIISHDIIVFYSSNQEVNTFYRVNIDTSNRYNISKIKEKNSKNFIISIPFEPEKKNIKNFKIYNTVLKSLYCYPTNIDTRTFTIGDRRYNHRYHMLTCLNLYINL